MTDLKVSIVLTAINKATAPIRALVSGVKELTNATSSVKPPDLGTPKIDKATAAVERLIQRNRELASSASAVTINTDRMGRAFDRYHDAKERSQKAMNFAAAASLAQGGVSRVAAGARGLVGSTLGTAMDFQFQMSRVKGASDGATPAQMDAMAAKARQLGMETKFSATEAAQGIVELSKAGFKATEAMAGIGPIMKLALVDDMPIAETSALAISVMSEFAIAPQKMEHVANVIAKAADSSTASIRDIGEAMSYVGPVAKELNVSLEETAAMTAALANAGIKGSRGGTALTAILQKIAAPDKMGRSILADSGIQTSDENRNLLPPAQILKNLAQATAGGGNQEVIAKLKGIVDSEAMAALAILMRAQSSGALDSLRTKTNAATGTVDELNKVLRNNAKGAAEEFDSAVEGLSESIGNQLLPVTQGFYTLLSSLVSGITNWTTAHPRLTKAIAYTALGVAVFTTALSALLSLVVVIASGFGMGLVIKGALGIAAAFIGGLIPALWAGVTAVGALALNFLLLNWPILAIMAAVGALVYGAYLFKQNWGPIKAWFANLWYGVLEILQQAWDLVQKLASVDGLKRIVGSVIPVLHPEYEKRNLRPTLNGAQSGADAGGVLKIQIDSEGRPTVRELSSNGGLIYDVVAGASMVTP